MRPLTEEETKAFYKKLAKYIGSNIRFLIDREDEDYVFRFHKNRVYYVRAALLKFVAHIGQDELVAFGVCFGKFTKTGKFRLHITCLEYLAKYAKYKIWVKTAGEQAFVYGNHVVKTHLAKMTENTPQNAGVVVLSMSDVPLGFGVTAKSTIQCRELEPTGIVAVNQCDLGEYLRNEDNALT
eukprot:TRINITY_DN304_c0_g1_i4.p1 TRINITY_DN304_c0_g1~~TRINITY_DN304_c0_g1_i4.p1  ORF type:complete len:182 (+),score=39.42 TRINITY_DN304_c0_g1_i4:107-652(+)